MKPLSRAALHEVPFSAYGSWLCVAELRGRRAPGGRTGIYLCSIHAGQRQPILQLLSAGPASGEVRPLHGRTFSPNLLCLSDGKRGRVEICFEGAGAVRLRGVGGARLRAASTHTVLYSTSARSATFNVPALRRYRVELLSGGLETGPTWKAAPSHRRASYIGVRPSRGGRWEIVVEEFLSTWRSRSRPSFQECATRNQSTFEKWVSRLPAGPTAHAAARRLAGYVDWSAVVAPTGLIERPAMLMSKNWMVDVWSWDHCFNALALAGGQPSLAWDQMFLMADHQDKYGAYPDALNDFTCTRNFSKPPIHGWATLELCRRNPSQATLERLERIYDSLIRWTRWWLDHRRLPGQVLPYYLHGNDSGWDNGTLFDQGVPLLSPDLAAFLVVQMDALTDLAGRLGKPKEGQRWKREADALFCALMTGLFDGDAFQAKLAANGRVVRSTSLLSCMPILLGTRLPDPVRNQLTKQIKGFLTPHGLATEHLSSPDYETNGYWRGPIWAPSTYLIVSGLERSGYPALARTISRRFCAMCARSGFAENFDARTGKALCDPAYTWTASVFLLLSARRS